jgi:hypothetical protein
MVNLVNGFSRCLLYLGQLKLLAWNSSPLTFKPVAYAFTTARYKANGFVMLTLHKKLFRCRLN